MADPNDMNTNAYRDRASFGGQQGYAQNAANNYTSLGQAAGQRAAYQNQWGQSDQSRGSQQGALGLMQSAAYGGQPSAAEIAGRNAMDQGLNNAMAIGASARGGSLAQAAAMRNAQTGAAAYQQQAQNQIQAGRAQEMAQARGDYMSGASGVRQQDLGQQGMNMQSELAQRQMNQQGQQFYDQMGFNALAQDQQGQLAREQMESSEYQKQKEINQHSQDRETGVIGSIVGGAGSAAGGILDALSDVTAKTNVQPIGAPNLADADYVGREQARYDALNATEAAQMKAAKKPGMGAVLAQGFGTFGHGVGNMPMYPVQARAMGGPMQPGQPYLVGEQGPELVMPQQPGQVLPARLTQSLGMGAAAGGMSPMSGPASPAMDKMGASGGLDVMGSLKAHSNFATQYQRNPSGGMMQRGGMMLSDDRTKLAAAVERGRKEAWAEIGEGRQLARDAAAEKAQREAAERRPEFGKGSYVTGPRATGPGSIDANLAQAGWTPPQVAAAPVAAPPEPVEGQEIQRPPPGRLARAARAFQDAMAQGGGAVYDAMSDERTKNVGEDALIAKANRAQTASSYSYKPEFTPPEQSPGEKNVGPMAQTMAADPVASTAVKKDPESGMLMLDGAKLSKLHSAGIASLQKQVDGLAALVAKKRAGR